MKKLLFALMALTLCLTFPTTLRGATQSQYSTTALSPGTSILCRAIDEAAGRVTATSSEQELNRVLEKMETMFDGSELNEFGNEVMTSADKKAVNASMHGLFGKIIEQCFRFEGVSPDPQLKEQLIRQIDTKYEPVVNNAVTLSDLGRLGDISL